MEHGNLFTSIPPATAAEWSQSLLDRPGLCIQRIISRGHTAPADGWFDQDTDEWVALLSGQAELAFEDGHTHALHPGDWLLIRAHQKHRITHTSIDPPCVWLAVHHTP